MRARESTVSIKLAIPFSTCSLLFGPGFTLGIAIMSRRSCRVLGIRLYLKIPNRTWIQSVPPAVAGGCMRSLWGLEPTAYPPATAGGTDWIQGDGPHWRQRLVIC